MIIKNYVLMMNKMMDSMIKSMSIEEREAMMLRMMPMMLKRTEPKVLIEESLKMAGKSISLYHVYGFLRKLVANEKITVGIKVQVGVAAELIEPLKPTIMTLIMPVIRKFMPLMMSFGMPVMSDVMSEMMSGKKCAMKEMMPQDKEKRQVLSDSMQKMMPYCMQMAGSLIDQPRRSAFAVNMISGIASAGSGDLQPDDQKHFEVNAIKSIMNSVISNQEENKCC